MIQAIEPPPVPMVSMSIIGMRTGKAPTAPPLVTCGLPPSIRQRSVEVPPASSVTTSGKPAISAITALPSAPAAGPDSAVVIGLLHDLLGARDAAARLHDQERLVLEAGAELVVHAPQIALHVRLDEGVDQGGHRALVFAIFRQHVAGERQRAVRIFLARRSRRRGARARGWRRSGSGRRRSRARPAGERTARRRARSPRRAAAAPARGNSSRPPTSRTKSQRHDALGLHPEIGIAVALGHRLAGDLQDVPEARGDDQAERADLALQQRIGGDRRAVGEAGDVVRRAAGCVEDRLARRAPGRSPDWPACSRTLVTRMAPEPLSTETISVKVPPVSMPIRKRGCRAADAIPRLLLEGRKRPVLAGNSRRQRVADRSRPNDDGRRAAAKSKVLP